MLLFDADAPALYLSPHCDDAVLGAWSFLTRRPCQVVTLFAGAPAPGTPAGTWDALCGYEDGYEVMQVRYQEERAALELAGIVPLLGNHVGSAYRQGKPSFDELLATVEGLAERASAICTVAAIDRHPTHVLVRQFAVEIAAAAGIPCLLHADPPYCIRYDWPCWVTGAAPNPRLRAEVHWQAALAPELPELAAQLEQRAQVVALDEQETAAKMQAIGCYGSQLEPLDIDVGGRLTDPERMRFEVFWPL